MQDSKDFSKMIRGATPHKIISAVGTNPLYTPENILQMAGMVKFTPENVVLSLSKLGRAYHLTCIENVRLLLGDLVRNVNLIQGVLALSTRWRWIRLLAVEDIDLIKHLVVKNFFRGSNNSVKNVTHDALMDMRGVPSSVTVMSVYQHLIASVPPRESVRMIRLFYNAGRHKDFADSFLNYNPGELNPHESASYKRLIAHYEKVSFNAEICHQLMI